MRLLGVDLGEKRIGLAVSDPTGMVASPVEVLEATGTDEQDVQRVIEAAERHGADGFVVGLPRSLRGTDEAAAARALAFAKLLSERSGKKAAVWDERLTTVQAERALLNDGVRRRARREKVDKVAAALILQSYLDAHHGSIEPEAPTSKADP
ncbi:MAG: Holliday junction resolvase RuvX [Armatimonadetes bacterium]|nr:Holliday junction resolvase RuvX [Armatimonadota bacterium]